MVNIVDKYVSFILVMLMIVSTGLQVFTRYILNNPLSGTEELSRICLIWLVFWGSAIGLKRKKHLSVSVIFDRLPKKIRQYINIFINIAILIFLGILVVFSYQLLTKTYKITTPALGISSLFIYIIIPISCILMIIQLAMVIINNVKDIK